MGAGGGEDGDVSGLTAVSLFAGVGGIDLALTRAGVEVVAAVEIDNAARGVIADRLPHTTLLTDVTKVTADDLFRAGFVPDRGVIAAGWPCQGNSVAGARGGMADPRSGLWRHVVRLLAETRARWFLGENVPGLLSVNSGDDIAVVRGDLAQLGYWWAERLLDAQHFGVPQRRRRIFFVGHLGGSGAEPVQVLLEPEGGGRDHPPSAEARPRVAATLTGGSSGAGVSAPGRPAEDDVNLVVAPTLTACGGKEGGRTDKIPMAVVNALTANGVGTCGADDNQGQAGHLVPMTFQKVVRSGERDADGNLPPEVWETRPVAATLNCGDNTSESRATELIVTATGDRTHALTAEGADASEDGIGRGTPVITALTTRCGNTQDDQQIGQLVTDETTVRRLTPLECERLQGFPDNWTATSNGKPQADSARYKQMGNAVAVPCVEWIARRLVRVA
jgi:DNA (cytosine-5)-methyltransferase 1